MQYRSFSFKNFKGIDSLTLPLTGRVTTLVGLNESGKTTLLEAIYCFSYGAENLDAIDPSMAFLREPERWVPISQRGNFNESIEISATIDLSDQDRSDLAGHLLAEHKLTLTLAPKSIVIVEQYRFENSRYARTERRWTLTIRGTKGREKKPRVYPGKSPEWLTAVDFLKTRLPRIWYFPNFLFELPDRFELEAVGSAAAKSEEDDKNEFYRLTFERILGQIASGADLETHVVERAKSADKTDQRNLQALLLEMARDMTTRVFDGWNRIFGRAPVAQEVQLDADVGPGAGAYLELKIKGPDGYYDLSERSLGFRWFFMFLLMTSYRGLSAEGEDVVFLLDEPASNLHSRAQAELLKSFEVLAEDCQLIYTTHSHHLINIKWLDGALVVKNEAVGDLSLEDYLTVSTAAKTSISATPYRRFVSEHPSSTSYFQPVLDLLEYRPSNLEPVPRVVLVEGKSDFYLLSYAMDVLNLRPQVRLVPGGGAGSLDPLIRLYIGWGKSFLVLLDGDSEGLKQQERYEGEFGPLLARRCITLNDLGLEDGVDEVEDLLSEAESERMIDAIFTDASQRPGKKKALLQAALELYGRDQRITLSNATRSRIRTVLKGLDERLQEQE